MKTTKTRRLFPKFSSKKELETRKKMLLWILTCPTNLLEELGLRETRKVMIVSSKRFPGTSIRTNNLRFQKARKISLKKREKRKWKKNLS